MEIKHYIILGLVLFTFVSMIADAIEDYLNNR